MRVNAQLIDAGSGAHLWAEQFDTPRADLLQTQDAVVAHLANKLDFQLTQAEAARLKRTPGANRDAEDLALQCAAGQWKVGPIGKEADAAFALCEQALAIDPNNVRALMALGIKFLVPVCLAFRRPKGDVERAMNWSKALAIDPDHAWARDQKGWVLLAQGPTTKPSPNSSARSPWTHRTRKPTSACGGAYQRRGEFDKSVEYFDKAILVNPYDRGLAYLYGGKASANFGLKRYDQAIEQFRQAIAINPNYIPWAHTILVAALALTRGGRGAAGLPRAAPDRAAQDDRRMEGAQQVSQQGVRRYLEVTERMYAGLRKAGMPEH